MKTIGVDEPTHKELKKLSAHAKMNMGEYLHQAALYFKRTGIDPSTTDEQSPHKAIKGLDKRVEQIIAFIKTMEMEKLNPLFERLVRISSNLEDPKLPTRAHQEKIIASANKIINDSGKRYTEEKKSNEVRYKELHDAQLKSNQDLTKVLQELIDKQTHLEKIIDSKTAKKSFF